MRPKFPSPTEAERAEIVQRLLDWFAVHERPLPWREAYDPYRIWIAEIMLQQTQIQTVIPYYHRFLERFPTVQALAEAPVDAVLQLWAGLGYYRRARSLHQAARQIVQRYGGRIPSDLKSLQALPGIGRYTAGAIRSIGFNLPAPVVDGNVTRVLTRLFAVQEPVQRAATQRYLWDLAEQLVPENQARAFNQAIMEFGATICTASNPRCEACPLSAHCRAHALGEPTRYPRSASPPRPVIQRDVAVIVEREGTYLIAQRKAQDRWGGLWEFPRETCAPPEQDASALERLLTRLGLKTDLPTPFLEVKHSVTHHRVTLNAYRCRWRSGEATPAGYAAVRWCRPEELPQYAAPAPQSRLVARLREWLAEEIV